MSPHCTTNIIKIYRIYPPHKILLFFFADGDEWANMSYDGLEWVLMQSILTHITSFELKLPYTLAINLELEGGRCNARQKYRRLVVL
jgi:hypothetical protein